MPLKNITLIALTAIIASVAISADARIHRSQSAKNHFKQSHPCPANGKTRGPCPGYIIDHINPLACGGPDLPANMQWQTKAASDAKDKWELIGCLKNGHNQ